jgi:hypothetical protein
MLGILFASMKVLTAYQTRSLYIASYGELAFQAIYQEYVSG